MNQDPNPRVLLIDDDATAADRLARFLSRRSYDVHTCPSLGYARSLHDGWHPHVLVLVPTEERERHGELEALRRLYPRVPVVLLTVADGPDVLLDVEAFAPTLAVRPTRGLGHIESAVAEAVAAA